MFYKQPDYYKSKFRIHVEISYEDFDAVELEQVLNQAYREEGLVFRTCLTVY